MNGSYKVFRRTCSRKTNELANKKDCMKRLHIQSSQEVRAYIERLKPKKRKKNSVVITDDDRKVQGIIRYFIKQMGTVVFAC